MQSRSTIAARNDSGRRQWLAGLLLLCASLAIVPAAAIPAIKPPAARAIRPYTTIQEIPRSVWFRGIKPPHLVDTVSWSQVEWIEPPGVVIQGEWFLPGELLGRFEWTVDPYVPAPVTAPCGN